MKKRKKKIHLEMKTIYRNLTAIVPHLGIIYFFETQFHKNRSYECEDSFLIIAIIRFY